MAVKKIGLKIDARYFAATIKFYIILPLLYSYYDYDPTDVRHFIEAICGVLMLYRLSLELFLTFLIFNIKFSMVYLGTGIINVLVCFA